MTFPLRRAASILAAGAGVVASASAQTIISDDFETDTSADYTLVDDGNIDGTQQFAFDYVAAGIPLAPRSSPGDTGGLRLTANDSFGLNNAFTLFHNTDVSLDRYQLTVDVFMGFSGIDGTTEYAHVGVGSPAVRHNQLFSPISGDGAFIASNGDGGATLSDYRWFRDPDNSPPGDGNTTLPNSHPSYLGNSSLNTGPFFQTLFPSPPSTVAGSPGNIWTTVRIDVDNVAGVISFYFDDELTFQDPTFINRFDGFVSLGLADTFNSIDPGTVFTLYDNLVVDVPGNGPGPIGSNYCNANPNSTGVAAAISGFGREDVQDNDVTLRSINMPPSQFGIFVTSLTSGFTPNVGSGNLCVDGQIGRFTQPNQIQQVDANGQFSLAIDLTQMPLGLTPVAVQPGETWYFQAWYRDFQSGGGNTSNLSDGLEITFQ